MEKMTKSIFLICLLVLLTTGMFAHAQTPSAYWPMETGGATTPDMAGVNPATITRASIAAPGAFGFDFALYMDNFYYA